MECPIIPLSDKVFILPIEEGEQKYGNIIVPDAGGEKFAIVKHEADTAAVDRTEYPKVYCLDEICRIIKAVETEMIAKTKEIFPDAKITKITPTKGKVTLDDEIPF